jgi:hypothetical protein
MRRCRRTWHLFSDTPSPTAPATGSRGATPTTSAVGWTRVPFPCAVRQATVALATGQCESNTLPARTAAGGYHRASSLAWGPTYLLHPASHHEYDSTGDPTASPLPAHFAHSRDSCSPRTDMDVVGDASAT